jgi:hypothetical protein
MTCVKLTPAERACWTPRRPGDPLPDDIFTRREANAAAIAALESQIQAKAGQ